jgi:hypothetical protein
MLPTGRKFRLISQKKPNKMASGWIFGRIFTEKADRVPNSEIVGFLYIFCVKASKN